MLEEVAHHARDAIDTPFVVLWHLTGGIDLAAHWAGFETIAFVEREPFCQRVLAKNFPGVPIYDDVTTYEHKGERPTLVSAGFPCQPHSLAGKRLASGDERDLWGEVVRILGEAKPRWFLGENVPGLLSSESGRFFGRVVDDLAALGYRVGWGMWGASGVGAVHRRNRVFIVAYTERSGCGRVEGRIAPKSCGNQPDDGLPLRDDPADVAYAEHDGRNGFPVTRGTCEGEAERRMCEFEGCDPADVAYARNLSDAQAPATASPIGTGRNAWDDAGGCDRCGDVAYANRERGQVSATRKQPTEQLFDGKGKAWGVDALGTGNWREWGIPAAVSESEVCPEDDGVSRRLVRSRRVATLKALGNAVVPNQVYPLLQAIADFEATSHPAEAQD